MSRSRLAPAQLITIGWAESPDPMVLNHNVARRKWRMARGHYVFGYEAEPADERPTGFGQTNFGQSGLSGLVGLSTVAAPWTASEHSTFDQPSRAMDRVQTLRERRKRPYVVAAIVLLAMTIIASAVTLAMR